ncbi:hypothetical protein AKJ16_DCAP04211, partial [Drosera capensis]
RRPLSEEQRKEEKKAKLVSPLSLAVGNEGRTESIASNGNPRMRSPNSPSSPRSWRNLPPFSRFENGAATCEESRYSPLPFPNPNRYQSRPLHYSIHKSIHIDDDDGEFGE